MNDIKQKISKGHIPFVSNIKNGNTNPTLSTITNLAKALGVSINELLK